MNNQPDMFLAIQTVTRSRSRSHTQVVSTTFSFFFFLPNIRPVILSFWLKDLARVCDEWVVRNDRWMLFATWMLFVTCLQVYLTCPLKLLYCMCICVVVFVVCLYIFVYTYFQARSPGHTSQLFGLFV